MIDIKSIPLIKCRADQFYSSASRKQIKYVVIHYTANTGDTAMNNCIYFSRDYAGASAHYFVDDNDILNSVPLENGAWAVGVGSGKVYGTPKYWGKCTNNNSVSIELCGSKTGTEASEKTKDNAAQLTAALLIYFGLDLSAVIRHYDITGKQCPLWAVMDENKWSKFKVLVQNYFYKWSDEQLIYNDENYQVFKEMMDRYLAERGEMLPTWEETAMNWGSDHKVMTGGRPKGFITRGEAVEMLRKYDGQKDN